MQFPTVAFAIFFLAAFVANWLLRPHPLVWRATMIAVSLYFCAWVDVRFALVVLGVAALNWVAAAAAHRAMPAGDPTPASRRIVRAAVAADVAVLAGLAYRGFLVESVTGALARLGWAGSEPVVEVVVPVGISIYVLHAIGYVVDVGRDEVEPVAFADLLLYLCFFPHLVAGPVVRVDELVPQFHERPDPRRVPATDAFVLVGSGLVKAVVIAPWLAEQLVDPAFAAPAEAGGLELLVAAYGVAVLVYAAFSGATDIAIGCALLLGIEYPRAFDAPFAALSVRDFWDRWNLTVSHWLRDYVYVPLGGSRRGRHLRPRNVMVTMVVGGLWYGAGWNFALWGVVHGVYVIVEQAAAARAERREPTALLPTALTAPLHWFVTFHLVCLAFVVYRAGSVGDAAEVLARVATLAPGGAGLVTPLVLAVIGATVASHFVPTEVTYGARARFSALAPAAQVAVLAAGLTVIAALGPEGPLPFGRLPF